MPRFIAILSSNLSQTLVLAQTLSPRVEVCRPDGLLLEVSTRHERDILDQLLRLTGALHFGVASTRMAALVVAKLKPGTIIPPGKERDFLSALPVNLSGLGGADVSVSEFLVTLARWGIRTWGDLAALPEPELAARLGQRGLRLQRMARGEDILPFQPYYTDPLFEESQELEWTLDSLQPLAFILGGILDRLCRRLQSCNLAVDSLRTVLKLANGSSHERTLHLALPMREPKALLSLLRLDLQSHPPQAGIVGISLYAEPTEPRAFQYSLFQSPALSPEKLSHTLDRLKALVGEENLGSPTLLNTHRPDAFSMKVFDLKQKHRRTKGQVQSSLMSHRLAGQLVLRRIRPPVPARIKPDQIVARAGPWRSSGDWWANGWSGEEWDIELADGVVYRMYWDRRKKGWFLEGIYD